MLEEANTRLKKFQITPQELDSLNSLYILLDLDKDTFCSIIDAVGVEKLIEKQSHYSWLNDAAYELVQKEKFLKAKHRITALNAELAELEQYAQAYSLQCRQLCTGISAH